MVTDPRRWSIGEKLAVVALAFCLVSMAIASLGKWRRNRQCSKLGLVLAADEVTCFDPSTRCVLDATDGPHPLCRKARP